jgi:O-antigen/teichoic acid export membrane protein
MLSGMAAVVAAGIIALMDGTVVDYLGAAAGALFVSCAAAAIFVFPGHAGFRFDRALFGEGVRYALRAYLATLFGFLLMRIGVIALEQQATFAQVGQFSIASQLTDAMILLPGTVALLLFPNLVRAAPESRWAAMLQSLTRLGLAMAALLLLAAAVIPVALPIIFGSAFDQAVPLTLAMLPMVLLVTLITVISQYLSSEGFPRGQVIAWIVGFAVQAILAFALAGRYGGYGIAIALFVSNSLVLALVAREAARMNRRRTLSLGPREAHPPRTETGSRRGKPSCKG